MKKTLFLDRDGVINRQIIGGYVTKIEEFEFLPGVLEALAMLFGKFDYVFIVTNQQGIGKAVFSVDDLIAIHGFMLEQIIRSGGRIDKIYFCPDLEKDESPNRKPKPGMGLQAIADYPDIDLSTSVMAGDSLLDMQFGKNLGVKTVFLTNERTINEEIISFSDEIRIDLLDFARHIQD